MANVGNKGGGPHRTIKQKYNRCIVSALAHTHVRGLVNNPTQQL
jgi:hypothetical protein